MLRLLLRLARVFRHDLTAIRSALERIADALEWQRQAADTVQGQVFRSYARRDPTEAPLTDQDIAERTEVSYVDNAALATLLDTEDELRTLLGRDPTEAELERAFAGREV